MMREIKFRCWNMHGKCMHGWDELVEKNKIHLLANQKGSYPIMQYTGLKDKNGVEIYEGDIVKMYHQAMYEYGHVESTVTRFKATGFNEYTAIGDAPDVRVVRWIKGALMLHCNDGGAGHSKSFNQLANPGESYEVIGNIYKNPELINA